MEQNQRPVESYEVQVLGLVMSHFPPSRRTP